jgi:hypothetical protein
MLFFYYVKELNAALFVYSKKTINNHERVTNVEEYKSRFRTVSQIDLVPTLSLLLGVPIPFGNLGNKKLIIGIYFSKGGVIPELFLHSEIRDYKNTFGGFNLEDPQQIELGAQTLSSLKRANIAIHVNSHQIYNYLIEYSKISKEFPKTVLHQLQTIFENTNKAFEDLIANRNQESLEMQIEKHKQVFYEYREFQRQVTKMCRDLWISFDLVSMTWGIVLLSLAVILLLFQLTIRESVPFSVVPVYVTGNAGCCIWIHGFVGFVGGCIASYGLSLTDMAIGAPELVHLPQFCVGFCVFSGYHNNQEILIPRNCPHRNQFP